MLINGPLSQKERLEAADHIRAIGSDEKDFAAYHAVVIDALLADMPVTRFDVTVAAKANYTTRSHAAAGVGNVTFDESKSVKWDPLIKEFRCGPYVVKKTNRHEFEIRHVGDVDAVFAEGEVLKLARRGADWVAYLNKVRYFRLWRMEIGMGGTFVEWKRSYR